ncbi:hypothetical protein HN873_028698 [Arachis hypogaea]
MVFSLTKPPSNETKTKPKEKHLGSCPIHLNSPSTSPSPAPPPRFPHSVLLSFRSRATGSGLEFLDFCFCAICCLSHSTILYFIYFLCLFETDSVFHWMILLTLLRDFLFLC